MTPSRGSERPIDRQALLVEAARRILDTGRRLMPEERETAIALLTDLYAAGVRHGISPEDWSRVSSLGHDCIDVIKQRALQQEQAERVQRMGPPPRGSLELGPAGGRDRGQAGRDLW